MNNIKTWVAKPEGIIVLKLRAYSPQDILDIQQLLKIADIDMTKLQYLSKRARVNKRLEDIIQKNLDLI
jgi:hypothetical protein